MQSKSKKLISETFVKISIIQWLSTKGWGRNLKFGELHEKGVDIRVKNNKSGSYFLIEAKGQGNRRQADYNNFYRALAQIVTRMNVKKTTQYKYGLGLPYTSANIALRSIPWRVAKRLKLYILSVNKDKEVTQYSWKDLQKKQENKRRKL